MSIFRSGFFPSSLICMATECVCVCARAISTHSPCARIHLFQLRFAYIIIYAVYGEESESRKKAMSRRQFLVNGSLVRGMHVYGTSFVRLTEGELNMLGKRAARMLDRDRMRAHTQP